MRTLTTLLALALSTAVAHAQGLVVPTEPDIPPLALMRHAVKVEIDRQAAVTTVEQVFQNNTERALEAQYVFPIPRGAALTDFTMLVNGRPQAGELVEKNEAFRIYSSIVRRAEDPGLLEYLGGEVFRASVFPIAPRGTQTITVRFSQVLTADGGLVSYLYPVRASAKKGPTVQGEFSFEAVVRSASPIRALYSPSHPVSIARKNDREARASYSSRGEALDRDVRLFYGVDEREVGFNLLTYRPDPSAPGYFLMLLSPRPEVRTEQVVERDLVFVLDVSGSMAGEKMKQARGALKHCLNSLQDGDRFNIVPFSSVAEPWRKDLVPAAAERKNALAFADGLLAQGGTNIAEALDVALSFPRSPSRPYYVIFMTDGKPTLGETTDPGAILGRAKKILNGARLFTWGVGYDLDTRLVDGLAEAGGGVSEYVRPEEDIEAKVSAFYAKTSRPVLTNLELQVVGDKIQLLNLLPRALPDLYAGTQLVLLGRYTGAGDVALRLTGRVNEAVQAFTYEGAFAASEPKHAYVEGLWARRQIGTLLDQIRLHGETEELKNDVIRLSREYGIQTPYTSFLILEPDPSRPLGAAGGRKAVEEKLRRSGALPAAAPAPKPEAAAAREAQEREQRNLAEGFAKRDGKSAVDAAQHLKRLKEADKDVEGDRRASVRRASKRRFFEVEDLWVDEAFEATHATTVVKFGSEVYFKILAARPDLKEALMLGAHVVVVTGPCRALVVARSGAETLGEKELKALLE